MSNEEKIAKLAEIHGELLSAGIKSDGLDAAFANAITELEAKP